MLIDESTAQGDGPEMHLSLLQTVGRVLADAPLPEDALDRIIRAVCTVLHWDFGARWREDEPTHELICTQQWHAPFLDNTAFVEMVRGTSALPHSGDPVRTVLRTGQPCMLEDMPAASASARAQAAVQVGLRSAFAFPLLAGGQILGVLEFAGRQPRLQSERLLKTGATIGAIAGEFIARGQSEERYRNLLERSADAIVVRGEGGHVFANRAAESALREQERAMSTLLRNLPGMAYRCRLDDHWTLEFVSDGAMHLTGYSAGDLVDNRKISFIQLVHPDDRGWVVDEIRDKLAHGERFVIEYQIVCADGAVKWVSEKAQAVRDPSGAILALEGIIDDVTERKRFEERLAVLAQYDVLTGLPNRSLFYDRLRQAIVRARREQTMVGLLFLDLDRFKQINDSLGHAAGDRVLKTIAERLKGFLREIDTIARLGGDEFTVIIEGVNDAAQVSAVAEKIRAALSDPIVIEGRDMLVSASVGITLYPRDAEDIEHLVKNADIAMYHAKNRGGWQQFQFYDEGMAPFAAERLEMEAKLKRALAKGEFLLQYQPTVDMKTGEIIGMEALVRWKSPEGLVPPGKFIPVAEESSLILDIGSWVLKAACAQLRAWQKEGLPPLRLSVNLSPLQIKQGNLLETISEVLRGSGLGADHLELDINENAIMDRSGDTIATLLRLEELGVHLCIDDFGTGYSSVAYLKRFPVHQLKIDKSFIADITVDSNYAAIVSAIIAMAKNLGLGVAAEGVETKAQLEFLRAAGCDAYQGYYFSVPLPANAFAELVRRQVKSDE
ncbi:MAG: EAL domain-containing protein [Betaproteobacteria bacterium]